MRTTTIGIHRLIIFLTKIGYGYNLVCAKIQARLNNLDSFICVKKLTYVKKSTRQKTDASPRTL